MPYKSFKGKWQVAGDKPTTGKTKVEQGQAKEEFTVISIDLEIYNGLKDWDNPQDNWSGGQFIPEDKEAGNENAVGNGAFTVANLNDTNSVRLQRKWQFLRG